MNSIFHGTPTSLTQPSGTAVFGVDVDGGVLYFKDMNPANAAPGWQPFNYAFPSLFLQSGSQRYTPTVQDGINGYANVPIVFSTPFGSSTYTVNVSLAVEGNVVGWQPNTFYSDAALIFDSNGMLETVSVPGISGVTEPVWNTIANGLTTDTGSTATVDLTSVSDPDGSGNTTYTGTITNGANDGFEGALITVAGFSNGVNNGIFTGVSSTATTITVHNPSGVSESASATATYGPLVWYLAAVTTLATISAVKQRTELGFVVEVALFNEPPSFPFTLHWTAIGQT